MAASSKLTAAQVVEMYQLLLDREPENADTVKGHVRDGGDRRAFAKRIINSREFTERYGAAVLANTLDGAQLTPPLPIDHDVSEDQLDAMIERIRGQWTLLGQEDPHWSVLTEDAYRADKLDDEALARFYASGKDAVRMMQTAMQRSGRAVPGGVCVELGAGVGRITRHLAELFERVLAVDISPGNLRLCAEYMAHEGVGNVETVQVSGLDDFEALPEFDFFYSIIVLQHNPPPIQKAILRTIFRKLKPGGVAYFQIPTSVRGYSFRAETYLSAPETSMELHCLPMHVVLEEMQAAGLSVNDVHPDFWVGSFGSFTFTCSRPETPVVDEPVSPEPAAITKPSSRLPRPLRVVRKRLRNALKG